MSSSSKDYERMCKEIDKVTRKTVEQIEQLAKKAIDKENELHKMSSRSEYLFRRGFITGYQQAETEYFNPS